MLWPSRASPNPPRTQPCSIGSVVMRQVYDIHYPAPWALPSSRNLYKSNKSPSGSPWNQKLNAPLASERRTAIQPLLGSGRCSRVTRDSRSGVISVLTCGASPARVWPACQRSHRPPTHPSVYSCSSRKDVALGASVQLPVGRLWAVGAIQATGQQVLPKGRIR